MIGRPRATRTPWTVPFERDGRINEWAKGRSNQQGTMQRNERGGVGETRSVDRGLLDKGRSVRESYNGKIRRQKCREQRGIALMRQALLDRLGDYIPTLAKRASAIPGRRGGLVAMLSATGGLCRGALCFPGQGTPGGSAGGADEQHHDRR